MSRYLIAVALFIGLPMVAQAQDTAATDSSDRTISWYMAHNDERKSRIAVCDNDPGHLANDPDCINAKKADNQAGVNDFKSGVDNTIQGAADFVHKF